MGCLEVKNADRAVTRVAFGAVAVALLAGTPFAGAEELENLTHDLPQGVIYARAACLTGLMP